MADVNNECTLCKHTWKLCDAQCPYRGCFDDREFRKVTSLFGPHSIVKMLGEIEDEQRRITVSKNMLKNAVQWEESLIYGPYVEINSLKHDLLRIEMDNQNIKDDNKARFDHIAHLQLEVLRLQRSLWSENQRAT